MEWALVVTIVFRPGWMLRHRDVLYRLPLCCCLFVIAVRVFRLRVSPLRFFSCCLWCLFRTSVVVILGLLVVLCNLLNSTSSSWKTCIMVRREKKVVFGLVLLVMFRLVSACFSLFSLTEHYWISRNQPAFIPAELALCTTWWPTRFFEMGCYRKWSFQTYSMYKYIMNQNLMPPNEFMWKLN
jgi:hypothetical protein